MCSSDLQERATLAIPVVLEAKNDLLKSKHSVCAISGNRRCRASVQVNLTFYGAGHSNAVQGVGAGLVVTVCRGLLVHHITSTPMIQSGHRPIREAHHANGVRPIRPCTSPCNTPRV